MNEDAEQRQLHLRLAGFIIQALSLAEDPAVLAGEIQPLKRDVNAGISTVELASSVGDVAFLLYHYLLGQQDNEQRTGRQIFEADLKTLEEAAEREAPGPRLMAHATTEDEAYILATTPATYRALTGQTTSEELEATSSDLLPTKDTNEARRDAATELLRLLRDADAQAATWLAAVKASGGLQSESDVVAFNEEETALALYLLDERSIQNLLRVLNVVISSARRQASTALGDEESS